MNTATMPLEAQPAETFQNQHGKLPVLIQTEAAECGLACVGMIAGFYGYETDLNSLRRRFPVSSKGLNLKQLIDIAAEVNLSARALKLDLNHLTQLQLPCVLHWEFNHFVVLKSLKKNAVVIHDPGTGSRTVEYDEFSEKFTGVALELTPTAAFKTEEHKSKLKITSLWSASQGLSANIVLIIIASLLIQLFSIATPFYMQTVVDDVLLSADTDLLVVLAIGFSLLFIVDIATRALREFIILHITSRLSMQMSTNLFRHLLRLPMDYFQKRHMGDIVSRFGSLHEIRDVLTTGVAVAIVDGVMAIAMLIAMFMYSVKLTLMVLILVSLYALVRIAIFKPMKTLTEDQILAHAKQESHFMESLRAIQTVKIFGLQGDRQNQWLNKLGLEVNKTISIEKWSIGYRTVNRVLFGTMNILVVYMAAQSIISGVLSIGMLFAFIAYKDRFSESIDTLITTVIRMKMLSLHLDRISDIAFAKVDESRLGNIGSDQSGVAKEFKGAMKVEGLEYSYNRLEAPVFSDINFSVPAGSTLAIIGSSGCGKTTLLKNLMGLLQADEGKVLVDDIPINDHPEYFSNVAGVMQDDQLLAGSIAENIACFSNNMDLEKVVASASLAAIHDDVMKMPMQYNTLVGDMGSALSGGQQQRIILARAYYQKPKILFLDEATSHLDVATERRVNKFVEKLNITRIIVAHRPETIKTADYVFNLSTKKMRSNS